MSHFAKHGRRCDTCGKFTNSKNGEYTRKDGSAGYIEWDCDEQGDGYPNATCVDCIESTFIEIKQGDHQ